jgi:hypothetical protein
MEAGWEPVVAPSSAACLVVDFTGWNTYVERTGYGLESATFEEVSAEVSGDPDPGGRARYLRHDARLLELVREFNPRTSGSSPSATAFRCWPRRDL